MNRSTFFKSLLAIILSPKILGEIGKEDGKRRKWFVYEGEVIREGYFEWKDGQIKFVEDNKQEPIPKWAYGYDPYKFNSSYRFGTIYFDKKTNGNA